VIITMMPGVGFLAPCYVLTTCAFLSLLHVKLSGTKTAVLLPTFNWSILFFCRRYYIRFKAMYSIAVQYCCTVLLYTYLRLDTNFPNMTLLFWLIFNVEF